MVKRVQVLDDDKSAVQTALKGQFFNVEDTPLKWDDGAYWRTDPNEYIFADYEVRVLGKHEGEYDPNHWGELDPDSYDRLGYRGDAHWGHNGHGRHLLDTGVN